MRARRFCKLTVRHVLPGTGGFDFGSRSAPFEGAATPKASGSAGGYLHVLCPDLTLKAKKVIAREALNLSRGEPQKPPRILISPAQVSSIIWPNMQCINPRCPMLLFSDQIAEELNEFFKGED